MEKNFEDILAGELERHKIKYSKKEISNLRFLYELLLEYNKKINLTAITEPHQAARKHFADSLLPLKSELFPPKTKCLDIGTGAGFPGLPLAIFLPECDFLLLDSIAKKLSFASDAIKKLGLKNVKIKVSRAENLIREENETRESFDVVFSRAVASLPVLIELSLPFVKTGGHFIAFKSKEAENELRDAAFAIKTLGGEFETIIGDHERNLIIIKKKNPTPEKYPRRNGVPEKRPLRETKNDAS